MSDLEESSLTNPGDVMENLLSEEEIFARLSVILQEALRIGTTKIKPEARVFDDLGAESLDLLDIRFRADESFGVKTSDEDLIRSLGDGLTAEEIQEKLTVRSLVLYIKNCLQEKSEIL
jgi:acyl carrier protein